MTLARNSWPGFGAPSCRCPSRFGSTTWRHPRRSRPGFENGWRAYLAALATPDTKSAVLLPVTVAVLAVPINTAFGVAAAWVLRNDPEAVMVVTPSDHVIEPIEEFRKAIRAAVDLVLTAEVAGVECRAHEIWPERTAQGWSFTRVSGVISSLPALEVRRCVKEWLQTEPITPRSVSSCKRSTG